ncbi:MAG: hypothetical protein GY816_22145 [Cytophagales bacterium]|nr:hypothetical protein [Cytophagales bacterium]
MVQYSLEKEGWNKTRDIVKLTGVEAASGDGEVLQMGKGLLLENKFDQVRALDNFVQNFLMVDQTRHILF